MNRISTFVFFDLETTGLPKAEGNQTKIVEACFIAVTNKDLKTTPYLRKPAMSRLIVQLNPERLIRPEATAIHGITNTFVQYSPTFGSKINTIKAFLEDLKRPVCLVAHNGLAFDFPIFLAEWLEVEDHVPDCLCVDSLVGFRALLRNSNVSHLTLSCDSSEEEDEDEEQLEEEEDEPKRYPNPFFVGLDELFYNSDKQGNGSKKTKIAEKPKVLSHSFRLSSVYQRLINEEIVGAHSAEGDCMMLLRCVVAIKEMFLPWARNNCKNLRHVKPLLR